MAQPKNVLKEINKSTRPCSNNKSINNIKSSTVGPTPVQSIKLQHPYYHHHCQGSSHLLTSIELMIIAREENHAHNHTNKRKGKLVYRIHTL